MQCGHCSHLFCMSCAKIAAVSLKLQASALVIAKFMQGPFWSSASSTIKHGEFNEKHPREQICPRKRRCSCLLARCSGHRPFRMGLSCEMNENERRKWEGSVGMRSVALLKCMHCLFKYAANTSIIRIDVCSSKALPLYAGHPRTNRKYGWVDGFRSAVRKSTRKTAD